MFEAPAGNTHDADLQPGEKTRKTKGAKGAKGAKATGRKPASAGVPGRKTSAGEEATVEVGELKKRSKELESLYKRKQDATEAYNLGVKAVAEASGLMSSVVGKFVKARADAKFQAKQREYEQLALVFAELGE